MVMLSFCFSCDEDETTQLQPRLNPQTEQLCKCVKCTAKDGDTTCYDLIDPQDPKILPKGHVCTKNLEPITTTPPTNSKPPDSLPPSRAITIIVTDSSNIYGFDDGREYYPYDKYNTENRVNYLSVKENGKVDFKLYINPGVFRIFNKIIAKIENTSIISFDSTFGLDTFVINDTLSRIAIYGRSESQFFPVRVTIKGINRSGEPKQLVCDTCEEELKVLCFKENVIDTLRIYRINNPSFNPPDSTFLKQFNKITNQSVLRVAYLSKKQYSKTDWDNNNNGILDIFMSDKNVPRERLEHRNLIDSIEKMDGTNISCTCSVVSHQVPKIMILPGDLRYTYLVLEDIDSGSTKVVLNSTKGISQFTKLRVTPWNSNSPTEDVEVNTVYQDTITVFYRFKGPHKKGDILFPTGKKPGGLTVLSCAWIMDTSAYSIYVHEFLHMWKIGPLSHTIADSSNIMFPNVSPITYRLRYRYLYTDNLYGMGNRERQWEVLLP